MYGYLGKLLFVDLSNDEIEVRDLNEQDARNFLGGAALGAKILYDEMPANTNWDAPESIFGIVTGPLVGSGAFYSGRYSVVSKSPVTNAWNDANSGGMFAPDFKKAGYDALFVKGIAKKPVYIWIDDGKVEIKDASHLWGLTTLETEEALRKEIGDPKINAALIGPAGENMSYIAAVMNDGHRAAARGGSGAVMGSKKLKAVVVRGNHKVELADKTAMLNENKAVGKWVKEGPTSGGIKGLGTFGTGGNFVSSALSGDAGVKNWKGAGVVDYPEEVAKSVTASVFDPKYNTGKYACALCPIGCGAMYKVENEKWPEIAHTTRTEYETVGAFASLCLIGDIEAVMMLNHLCNQYGLDTMSAGGIVAWVMECYDEGLISQEELDGLDLKWGNADAAIELLHKIGRSEGCGSWIKLGSKGAADHIGRGHEFLVVASGIEEPQHDSRLAPGRARVYKYDPTPGRHVKGGIGMGQGNQPPEIRYNFRLTGFRDAIGASTKEITQSSGLCEMTGMGMPPGTEIRMINAATGFNYSPHDAFFLGLRMWHMRNAFNLREGWRRKDYTMSDRFTLGTEFGPLVGVDVDVELLADNFFNAIGLTDEMMPEKAMLDLLGGMEKVAADLLPPPPAPSGPTFSGEKDEEGKAS